MLTKSILTATALALAAGVGSASAGERFESVAGTPALVMSNSDMDQVVGNGIVTLVIFLDYVANANFFSDGRNEFGTFLAVELVDSVIHGNPSP